jgi:hypothetical protein
MIFLEMVACIWRPRCVKKALVKALFELPIESAMNAPTAMAKVIFIEEIPGYEDRKIWQLIG